LSSLAQFDSTSYSVSCINQLKIDIDLFMCAIANTQDFCPLSGFIKIYAVGAGAGIPAAARDPNTIPLLPSGALYCASSTKTSHSATVTYSNNIQPFLYPRNVVIDNLVFENSDALVYFHAAPPGTHCNENIGSICYKVNVHYSAKRALAPDISTLIPSDQLVLTLAVQGTE
jgi:hypothetical protein